MSGPPPLILVVVAAAGPPPSITPSPPASPQTPRVSQWPASTAGRPDTKLRQNGAEEYSRGNARRDVDPGRGALATAAG